MSKVFDIAFKLGGQLTSSFKNAFTGANKAMGALTAAAGALGGTVALAGIVDQVTDMQDALAKLSAQTGTYGADMKELESVAKNVFKAGYGESFDEVTTAMMQVKNNMHGLDNGEIEKVTGYAMMLADTFDSEVNEVTRGARGLMSGFGIDAETAFDVMARGAQSGLNFSNDLFDQMAEFGPLWGGMGFSLEDMFGKLVTGAENGAYQLDYLNDIMKEYEVKTSMMDKSTVDAFASMSKEAQKAYKSFLSGDSTLAQLNQVVSKELGEMTDQTKAFRLGVDILGTKFEDLGQETAMAFLTSQNAMGDFQGSMDKMTETRFGTFNEALKGIGRTLLTDLVLPVGQMALPYMTQFANYLRENLPAAVEATKAKFAELKPYFLEYAPMLLGAVAAIGAMKATIMAVNGATKLYQATMMMGTKLMYAYRTAMLAFTFAGGGLKGIIAGLRNGLAALNVTMLANPVGIVVVAIAALGAAFFMLYKKSEEFRTMVQPLFAEFMSGAQQIKSAAMAVLPSIIEAFTSLGSVVVSLATAAIPLLLSIAQAVFPVLIGVIQLAVPIISALIGSIAEILTGVVVPALHSLMAVVQFIFPYIQLAITTAVTFISGILQSAMLLIQGDWSGAWEKIKSTAETIIDNVVSFFKGINLYEAGVAMIKGLIDGIKSMGSSILSAIGGLIPKGLKSVASKVLGSAIPGFAMGGVVNAPTLAMVGEGGDTESIIPWNNSTRSKALWLQTGKAIGMLDRQEETKASTAKAMQKTVSQSTNTNTSSTVINYSPNYNLTTNQPDEMQRVLKQNDDDFASKYNRYMQDEERLAF